MFGARLPAGFFSLSFFFLPGTPEYVTHTVVFGRRYELLADEMPRAFGGEHEPSPVGARLYVYAPRSWGHDFGGVAGERAGDIKNENAAAVRVAAFNLLMTAITMGVMPKETDGEPRLRRVVWKVCDADVCRVLGEKNMRVKTVEIVRMKVQND